MDLKKTELYRGKTVTFVRGNGVRQDGYISRIEDDGRIFVHYINEKGSSKIMECREVSF